MRPSHVVRKPLALLLALSLLVLPMAACTPNATQAPASAPAASAAAETEQAGQTPAPTAAPEPYKIQVLSGTLKAIKTSADTDIGKVLNDKFGIEFEFLPATGDLREKLTIMLSSEDYPEILRIEGLDIFQQYVKAGALVALDDFLPNASSFTARFKEQIPYWRLAAPDGKLYKWEQLMPQEFEVSPEAWDIGVRTDALEKQGWPNLLSEDDWFNFLQKAMQDMPETNGQKTLGMVLPLAESWGIPGLFVMAEKGGVYVDQGTNVSVIWNQADQKWEHMFTNKHTIENFRFFNRLYRAGILDKDCFTDYYSQAVEKIQSGRALSLWYMCWELGGANAALLEASHPEMQYINMPLRSNSQVEANLKREIRVETTRAFDTVVITKNCKDPARLFQMVDWCVSEEGQILLQSGIEGKHYTVVDGKRAPTEEFVKGILTDTLYGELAGFGLYRFLGHCKMQGQDGIAYDLTADAAYSDNLFLTDRQKEAFSELGWKNSKEYWLNSSVSAPNGLAGACMLDPTSEMGALNQKLTEFRVTATTQLVTAKTAEEFDALLAKLIEEYNKMDPDRVVDAYNQLLNDQKAKLAEFQK